MRRGRKHKAGKARHCKHAASNCRGKELLTGEVRAHHAQLYFVPDSSHRSGKEEQRFPIPPAYTLGALAGDRVSAYVGNFPGSRKLARRGGGMTARVAEVSEPCREDWNGVYEAKPGAQPIVRGDGLYAPPRMLPVELGCDGLSHGVLVRVVPLEPYTGAGAAVRVRVEEVLGKENDPKMTERLVIHRYGLREEFREDVLQEVEELPRFLPEEQYALREDWREQCVVTVDPPDARDFDDAFCLRRLPERQGWELAVHIADVSFYVRPGCATDAEARRRGNSTYLPGVVLPMLPELLCNDLCSLVPGKDRPTVLCLMQLDSQGRVQKSRVARAIIRSCMRLDYPQLQALISEGKKCGGFLRGWYAEECGALGCADAGASF